MDVSDFSAAGIRAALARKAKAKAAEERAHRERVAAEHQAMRDAFDKQELPPDALERVMSLVMKAVELGEKEALVYHFPSEFMKDSGRCLTSHHGDWRAQMTGAAARAVAAFDAQLAPRGFALRAGILDYRDGMPGDVGFWIGWQEEEG